MPNASVNGVCEISYTSGTGDYVVSGAIATDQFGAFRFRDKVANLANVFIKVTNGPSTEYVKGIFTYPDKISRDNVVNSSNDNNKIDWPETGQRIVELVIDFNSGLPAGGKKGDQLRKYSDVDWDVVWQGSPYPIAFCLPGLMFGGNDDERTRAGIIVTESVEFDTNFMGSFATCRVPSTLNKSFDVNSVYLGSSVLIGHVLFESGLNYGKFDTIYGEIKTLEGGKEIELFGEAIADDTLRDVKVTFKARRL